MSGRIRSAFSAEERKKKLDKAEAKAVGKKKAKPKPKKPKKSVAKSVEDSFWS